MSTISISKKIFVSQFVIDKVADTEMGCNEKYLWTCLAKNSIIGCYSYIADHVQHMSTPNGISGDLVFREGESKRVDNLTTSGKSSKWEKG